MPKKGENIYKRKDKRWEGRYLRGYGTDGAPKYGYCYGRTYREVKEKLAEVKAQFPAWKVSSSAVSVRCFGFYCDEWLALNRNRIKESTYVKYYGIMEKHIKPRLGGMSLRSLSTGEIGQFSRELLCDVGLAPKTVKDILLVLNSVIRYAAKENPWLQQCVAVAYPKIPKNEMRVLTREEQTALVAYLLDETDECKFGVLLALLTGMRIGEICALRWENISLDERTLRVDSTMQRLRDLRDGSENKTRIIISEPKTGTSARVIPLTDYAVRLCRSRMCRDPAAFVLTGDADRYIEPRTMQYRMERYCRECGLEDVHFHTLRHTFATRCVEVDFEIKSLSEILGHSSPRITLERYVHSSMELKRSNMEKLSAIGY